MKNVLALLAAVGLVVTVAVFANRPAADQSTTVDPAADVPAQQVQTEDGCCGLEGLLGAPVGKVAPVVAEATPAAAASGDECGAACPNAMLSGTCCMELAGAAAKSEPAHACCAEGAAVGAAAATACEHAEGAVCCEECVTAPPAAQEVQAVQKDQ